MNSEETKTNIDNEVQARIRVFRETYEFSLDLSDLGLTQVPDEIKSLCCIRSLNLSENNLTELPDFICKISSLEYLDISYNKLSKLPEKIGNLLNIEIINARCNEIKSIPESIGKLTLLNTLDISYNHLSSLPEKINNLIHLKHCNIKGNNIQILPDKISELMKQKDYSFFGHIEQIIALTGRNGLSKDFISTAKPHIEYISNKLQITDIQAILFSHIVAKFEDNPVGMQEIAQSLNSNRIKVMQHINDFDELERKRLIRSRSQKSRGRGLNNGIPDYYIPKEVLTSLLKTNEYQPINQSNLSIIELFNQLEIIFSQRIGDAEISYSELVMLMHELLEANNHLSFVKRINEYGLSQDNLMILLRFCHFHINLYNTEIDIHEISRLFDRVSDFTIHKRLLKNGEHILLDKGFIENTNSDGFSNRESFKLTDKTRKELLSEIKIKTSRNNRGIIHSDNIQAKSLFYNEKEKEQINRLTSVLNEHSFKKVQERLSDSGMRTGFACLFSGSAGTGKSETVYQIARRTGRDILMVDIAESKSMWFGESEKIIKSIFSRYKEYVEESEVTPILLFNEADAIFGKRKDVSSSAVAQTENAIQNIILQEIENLNGILIATTNLVNNFDKAFERRFIFKIEFKKPEHAVRQLIWQSMIPALSNEDAKTLSTRFDFSGGQIENISRKRTIEFVLSGIEPSLDKIILFCQEELLEGDNTSRIGFGT